MMLLLLLLGKEVSVGRYPATLAFDRILYYMM